jgi:hypothetical protein
MISDNLIAFHQLSLATELIKANTEIDLEEVMELLRQALDRARLDPFMQVRIQILQGKLMQVCLK